MRAKTTALNSVYQSTTDIPGFLLKITTDKAVTKQSSIAIALDLQPDSKKPIAATLAKKFGTGYLFFMNAQLDTSRHTFSVDPKGQTQQPIEQGLLSFHWIATPLYSGNQAVDIVVKGIWVPQQGGQKPIEYYLGNHTWHITVGDETIPWFILGQINLLQSLGYFASVLISVSFLEFVRRIYNDRKRRQDLQDDTSVSLAK